MKKKGYKMLFFTLNNELYALTHSAQPNDNSKCE